jgi:hypothetical protein
MGADGELPLNSYAPLQLAGRTSRVLIMLLRGRCSIILCGLEFPYGQSIQGLGSSIEASLRDDRDNELFDGASAGLGQGRVGCFLCADDSSRSGNAR